MEDMLLLNVVFGLQSKHNTQEQQIRQTGKWKSRNLSYLAPGGMYTSRALLSVPGGPGTRIKEESSKSTEGKGLGGTESSDAPLASTCLVKVSLLAEVSLKRLSVTPVR